MTARSGVAAVRRVLVWLIIASFGLAAVLGIVVLLGVEIGDTAARVLATTATIGAFSVTVLCGAALLGRPAQLVGVATVAVSILTAGYSVWLIWDDGVYLWDGDAVLKLLLTGISATAALSLASLLLLLRRRRRHAVRIGLGATLALMALVLGLTLYLIWATNVDDNVFPRVYGIVAILAALGAVVVPVLSLLLPDSTGGRTVSLDPALAEQLVATAERRGITVAELVAPVLAEDRASRTDPDA